MTFAPTFPFSPLLPVCFDFCTIPPDSQMALVSGVDQELKTGAVQTKSMFQMVVEPWQSVHLLWQLEKQFSQIYLAILRIDLLMHLLQSTLIVANPLLPQAGRPKQLPGPLIACKKLPNYIPVKRLNPVSPLRQLLVPRLFQILFIEISFWQQFCRRSDSSGSNWNFDMLSTKSPYFRVWLSRVLEIIWFCTCMREVATRVTQRESSKGRQPMEAQGFGIQIYYKKGKAWQRKQKGRGIYLRFYSTPPAATPPNPLPFPLPSCSYPNQARIRRLNFAIELIEFVLIQRNTSDFWKSNTNSSGSKMRQSSPGIRRF